jgi:hydrogenase-4 membrane subunit HyfE
MRRTPRERAAVLRRWSAAAIAAGVLVGVAGLAVPRAAGAASLIAAALLIAGLLVAGIAATRTTRSPELAWIVVGLLVFWVADTTLCLTLLVRANTQLENVPEQGAIDLLSALFAAGIGALLAAGLLYVAGWVVRPGRWHLMNGPGGQS